MRFTISSKRRKVQAIGSGEDAMTLAAGEPATQAAAGARQAGRLADPGMGPGTDPRIDPRLLAALVPFGLDAAAAPPPLTRDTPSQSCASS
jgi:hypothetical protein